ncbi:MAG: hypothetical protein J1F18_11085 [Lachnospiraceae bacterium]|nr:hypothetical protein [Lachnospiraceae bacterium]
MFREIPTEERCRVCITYEDAGGTSHTKKVKADQNGNIHIEDDWTGKNVKIVKKSNGTTTEDSAGKRKRRTDARRVT